jgi:hypothetical protein
MNVSFNNDIEPCTIEATMSLLANVLGFSAFGFATRCFQLGLQKRFMFAGTSCAFRHVFSRSFCWMLLLRDGLADGVCDCSASDACVDGSGIRSGRMGRVRVGTATVSSHSYFRERARRRAVGRSSVLSCGGSRRSMSGQRDRHWHRGRSSDLKIISSEETFRHISAIGLPSLLHLPLPQPSPSQTNTYLLPPLENPSSKHANKSSSPTGKRKTRNTPSERRTKGKVIERVCVGGCRIMHEFKEQLRGEGGVCCEV